MVEHEKLYSWVVADRRPDVVDLNVAPMPSLHHSVLYNFDHIVIEILGIGLPKGYIYLQPLPDL